MKPPVYQRVYRAMRYNLLLKPGLDIASPHALRAAGALLTSRQEGQLVLLGHMRSGSSLLSTILTANPDINGYGEAKVIYNSAADFLTLRGKIAIVQLINRRLPQRRFRFVYDKVLHQRLMPSTKPLEAPSTHLIMLTRSAEPSLRSIMGTFGWEAERAARYLFQEYEHLTTLAQNMPEGTDVVNIHHEDLIGEPEAVLDALTSWLGLKTPLTPEFDPKARVKLVGSSDRSERIDAGQVLQTARKHEVDISNAPLDELKEKLDRLRSTINEHGNTWEQFRSNAAD